MSLSTPKISTQTVSPSAVAPAPAAQGADALRLGVTGDPLDDDLLNGRSSALLGKLRLRVGRTANVLATGSGVGSSDIARAGGVGAGSTGSTSGTSGQDAAAVAASNAIPGNSPGASLTGTSLGGSTLRLGQSRKVLD